MVTLEREREQKIDVVSVVFAQKKNGKENLKTNLK